ncbi:MAG: sulfite exporter TauE/SafE family protein [Rubrivivax sp.]|nr:sulfite exporter TauE/SafE family protein [Rubrivivax sp.]
MTVELLPLAWTGSLGAVVGAVLALTGAGGGAIAVPLLVFGAGLSMQAAAPVALVAVGLAAVLGAVIGLRAGRVRYRAAALIGVAGMLLAPGGVALAARMPQQPLLLMFAAFMAWTAWRMWRPAVAAPGAVPVCRRPKGEHRLRWTRACAWALAGTGAVAGLLSGLLGVGGGFVIVPALLRRTNLDLHSIQATSLAVIALVTAGGIVAAAWQGQLQAGSAGPFALGAAAGLLLGRQFAGRLAPDALRRGFAVVTGLVATLMVWRVVGTGM